MSSAFGGVSGICVTVVKLYDLIAALLFPVKSSIDPESIVTKYCVLLDKLFVGLMVSVLPEIDRLLLDVASKDSTNKFPAVFKEIDPEPLWIVSLNVKTMLLSTGTSVAEFVGLNTETDGIDLVIGGMVSKSS